ncbi:hypothetical protein [Protaetiibacter intestinalis]|uniref:hypothetical protein n=1 Tax=Protaetiibacter intestinalis TaxID=2419774 RepID=UPI001300949C|nr:hypothetical protein [Protaetiibacter intestinalis]
MGAAEDAGASAFIADLAEQGIEARVDGPAVVYGIEAVAGARVGTAVGTAVSINELGGWPALPPHWVHFPEEVRFESTNTDNVDCLPGWLRHSRDIGAWSMDRPPALNWLAHVRGLVSGAIG